jgi:thiamine-phosphate pyrophosphorylase
MLVTDRSLCPLDRLLGLVVDLVAAGVDAVQLREKDLPADELANLARRLRPATAGRALLFVNGAADVALDAGADGVQLGEEAESAAAVRARAGGALLISRSVHDVDRAAAAERDGADLLVLGTIYPSRSHPGGAAAGPVLVRSVAGRVRLPVIGIGGIDVANAGEVIRAGASGVAVISAILAAPDPVAAAAALRAVVDGALAHHRDRASPAPGSGRRDRG